MMSSLRFGISLKKMTNSVTLGTMLAKVNGSTPVNINKQHTKRGSLVSLKTFYADENNIPLSPLSITHEIVTTVYIQSSQLVFFSKLSRMNRRIDYLQLHSH